MAISIPFPFRNCYILYTVTDSMHVYFYINICFVSLCECMMVILCQATLYDTLEMEKPEFGMYLCVFVCIVI